MPYESEAQRGKFHELLKQGKISQAVVDEFDKASAGMKLPKRKADPAAIVPQNKSAHDAAKRRRFYSGH